MPELPEVETVRRAAEGRLAARVIARVTVRNPQLRRSVDTAALRAACEERRILGMDRRGKFLIARLDGSEGRFALRLRVYARADIPCPRCGPGYPVRRRVQQKRSTFYCPNCQH